MENLYNKAKEYVSDYFSGNNESVEKNQASEALQNSEDVRIHPEGMAFAEEIRKIAEEPKKPTTISGKISEFIHSQVAIVSEDIAKNRWGALILKGTLVAGTVYLAKELFGGIKSVSGWVKEKIFGKEGVQEKTSSSILSTVLKGTLLAKFAKPIWNIAKKAKIPMGTLTKVIAAGGVVGLAKYLGGKADAGGLEMPLALKKVLDFITGKSDAKEVIKEASKAQAENLKEEVKKNYEALDKEFKFKERKDEIINLCKKSGIEAPDFIKNITAKEFYAKLKESTGKVLLKDDWQNLMAKSGFIWAVYKIFGKKTLALNAGFYLLCIRNGDESIAGKLMGNLGKKFDECRAYIIEKFEQNSITSPFVPLLLKNFSFEKSSDKLFALMEENPEMAMLGLNATFFMRGFIWTFIKTMAVKSKDALVWGVKNPFISTTGAFLLWSERRKIIKALADVGFEDGEGKQNFLDGASELLKTDLDGDQTITESVGSGVVDSWKIYADFLKANFTALKSMGATESIKALQNKELFANDPIQYGFDVISALSSDSVEGVFGVVGGSFVGTFLVGGKWVVLKPLQGYGEMFMDFAQLEFKSGVQSAIAGQVPIMATAGVLTMLKTGNVKHALNATWKITFPRLFLTHRGHVSMEMALKRSTAAMHWDITGVNFSRKRAIMKINYLAKKIVYYEGTERNADKISGMKKELRETIRLAMDRNEGNIRIPKIGKPGEFIEFFADKTDEMTDDLTKIINGGIDDILGNVDDNWFQKHTIFERTITKLNNWAKFSWMKNMVKDSNVLREIPADELQDILKGKVLKKDVFERIRSVGKMKEFLTYVKDAGQMGKVLKYATENKSVAMSIYKAGQMDMLLKGVNKTQDVQKLFTLFAKEPKIITEISKILNTTGKARLFYDASYYFAKSGKATEEVIKNLDTARNALRKSGLVELSKFQKGFSALGIGAGALSAVFNAGMGGFEIYEGMYDENEDRGDVKKIRGGVYLTKGAIDTGIVMSEIAALKAGVAATGLGAAVVVAVEAVGYLAIKGVESAEETTLTAKNWHEQASVQQLVHNLIATPDDISAGDSYRAFFTTYTVEGIVKEKYETRKKIYEALIMKEYNEQQLQDPKVQENIALRLQFIEKNTYKMISQSQNEIYRHLNNSRTYGQAMLLARGYKAGGAKEYTVINNNDEGINLLDIENADNKDVLKILKHYREDEVRKFKKQIPESRLAFFDHIKSEGKLSILKGMHKKLQVYMFQNKGKLPEEKANKVAKLFNDIHLYLYGIENEHNDFYTNPYMKYDKNEKMIDVEFKEDELESFYNETLAFNQNIYDKNSQLESLEEKIVPIENDPIVYAVYEVAKMYNYTGKANTKELQEFFIAENGGQTGIYWDGNEWVVSEEGWESDNEVGNSGEGTVSKMIEEIRYQPDNILEYRQSALLGDIGSSAVAHENLKSVALDIAFALERGLQNYKKRNKK